MRKENLQNSQLEITDNKQYVGSKIRVIIGNEKLFSIELSNLTKE